jgi:hypothetical protein
MAPQRRKGVNCIIEKEKTRKKLLASDLSRDITCPAAFHVLLAYEVTRRRS